MFKQSDVSKYALPGKPIRKKTLIDQADETVDIRDILTEMKIWAPTGDYYSYKIYCPWHNEHSDQFDKNCRIFPPTNVYCWAMHGFITPTYLYSRYKSISREKAAEVLLEERGLLHRPWRERWNDLVDARAAQTRKLGSKDDFISALTISLRMIPDYELVEYHSLVRSKWNKILGKVDAVWDNDISDNAGLPQLEMFFNACLTALHEAVTIALDTEE